MNDTDDFFKYDLQKVEKKDSTSFQVDCESDLFVDLDDEWHVSSGKIIFARKVYKADIQ